MADQVPNQDEPNPIQTLLSMKRVLFIVVPLATVVVVGLTWMFSDTSDPSPIVEPEPETRAEIDAADPPEMPASASALTDTPPNAEETPPDLLNGSVPGLIPEEEEEPEEDLIADLDTVLRVPPPPTFNASTREEERLSQLEDALHASPMIEVSASVRLPPATSNGDSTRQVEPPGPNEYALTPGTVIPAVLLQGITTELPGIAVAHVSQDVFDSRTGAVLLLPRGSRLSGSYTTVFDDASERLVITWTRIDRPDGSTVLLEDVLGADQSGNAGLRDLVDRNTGQALALTGVTSLITAGLRYAAERSDPRQYRVDSLTDVLPGADRSVVTEEPSFGSNASEELSNQYGRIVQQIAQRHLNKGPVLTIRPGMQFVVQITREITVPAYASS